LYRSPLSSIGVPYYRDTLLSAWPGHLIFEVGAPSAKIDPLILKAMKATPDGTNWAPNPKTRKRNQASEYVRLAEKTNDSIMAPKFLSEKARSVPDGNGEQKSNETLEAMTSKLDTVTKKDVPFYYANVEIKYSKFGVDDFDFALV
jgi:PAB-dependent poly(A)-specific ribonuclease subunit 2